MKVLTKEIALSEEELEKIKENYLGDRTNTVLRNALSKTEISNVVSKSTASTHLQRYYNIEVKTMKVTDQKRSGRCWIFSALNLLREEIANKLNIPNFELSQNYIGFYDKLEKFNFLLNELVLNIDNPLDERLNQQLLETGIADGGQWVMFANLVRKYGLCPKSSFDDSFQASNTLESNKLLTTACKQFAIEAKKLHEAGEDEKIEALRSKYIKKAYQILASCYGVPPQHFDLEYYDADNRYHNELQLTPKSFFEKYIGDKIDNYVSIIHAPTANKEYYERYHIEHLGNVVGGNPVVHLNLPMERIKELIIANLKDGHPLWFGADVGYFRNRENGYWDDGSFDYLSAFDQDLKFDKAEMLDSHHSVMNHAMLITGVTVDENGRPIRWKIENSWGNTGGSEGYYQMSDSWFTTFVYQVVISREYFNENELKALAKEPHGVPLHDPFGTLAE